MAFTCPDCGRTSHNPNDEAQSYCGSCHEFKPAVVFLCPVCNEQITVVAPRTAIDWTVTTTAGVNVLDAFAQARSRGVVNFQEQALHTHVETHSKIDILRALRAAQDDKALHLRESHRLLTAVVEAAGGSVEIPDRLFEQIDDTYALVRWDDPSDSTVKFRVNKEVHSERT